MLESLIFILILGLVLYVIYWVAGQFMDGVPLKIVGIIIAVIFVVVALQRLGVMSGSGKIHGIG